LFVRERPFITHTAIDPAAAPLDRYSFPSGHTLHAVSFAWQASAHFPELAWVLLPLAALIAGSRVVLGLHYPTDVVAGAAIGAAPSEEPGVLRVPATKVPRDPEDRRMGWRALTRALDALPGGRFDLVHIHTPFIAHYAGVRLARRADIPAIATYHTFLEEYLHH